jgi:CheY-like chemotaxis protein
MTTTGILVVDDEPSMLEIIGEWLGGSGYSHVRFAGDGREALEMCRAERFELVISDIHMPRMDGIELLRNLRELGQRMPAIVFVSGYDAVDQAKLLSLGASSFLLKPFRRNDLIVAVKVALMGRGGGAE